MATSSSRISLRLFKAGEKGEKVFCLHKHGVAGKGEKRGINRALIRETRFRGTAGDPTIFFDVKELQLFSCFGLLCLQLDRFSVQKSDRVNPVPACVHLSSLSSSVRRRAAGKEARGPFIPCLPILYYSSAKTGNDDVFMSGGEKDLSWLGSALGFSSSHPLMLTI